MPEAAAMNDPVWTKGAPRALLLATDLSARSDRALDRAVSLAAGWKSNLTVLHVLEEAALPLEPLNPLPSWRRPPEPLDMVRSNILTDLGELAATANVLVDEGDIVDSIMRVAHAEKSDLIVIGVARNELLGKLMLGRTVDRLLRRSAVPLLVVKERPRRAYRHIVVATDFSESSRHALVAAMNFFPDETLTVFHAYDPPMSGLMDDAAAYRRDYRKIAEQECGAFLQDAKQFLNQRHRPPHLLIEYGAPNHLLRDYAADKSADLVVVGTHGRSAIFDVLLGSVAKRILEDVPCDILVIREPRAKMET
jgi:nucleotide-binding universal stress UspA family protein